MKFLICFQKKNKVKVIGRFNTLDSLIMVSSICKSVVENLAIERKMTTKDALQFVIDSIYESNNLIHKTDI